MKQLIACSKPESLTRRLDGDFKVSSQTLFVTFISGFILKYLYSMHAQEYYLPSKEEFANINVSALCVLRELLQFVKENDAIAQEIATR